MRNKDKQDHSDDSDDDKSDASRQIDTDNSPKNIPIAKLGERIKTKKIVINISDTQYPIIEEIAEELGWVIQRSEGVGDWDVWWTDRQIEPNTLFRMHLHQKINHFPGIYILARKNLLGLNLMAMKEHFPHDYSFFPQTWIIPSQFSQFRHYYQSVQKGKARTYIVKPQALSQGRGIFLTRNIDDILNGRKYVIQKYIKNPLLIDRLKFDLRIYVLMAGTDPLRLYIYHQGLTRFATEEYQEPTQNNLAKSYIHLTNYSLNKSNPNYIFNTSEKDMDKGHKRTLTSTYDKLKKLGHNVQKLKLEIEDAIIKTVISGLPSISHQYRYCQPEEYEGNMCFHILGFDVMITQDMKPIIIEVNHTPSFQTGTPLDYLVKKNLVKDTLKLMRITQKNKKKQFQREKEISKIRVETGKRQIFKGKEREEMLLKAQKQRDLQQADILGGYKKIFPCQNPELMQKYEQFYQQAVKIMKEDNQTRKKLLNDEKRNRFKADKPQKLEKKISSNTKEIKIIQEIQQIELNEFEKEQKAEKESKSTNVQTKKDINIEVLQSEVIQSLKNDLMCSVQKWESTNDKRQNFRMKISKKQSTTNGSSQHLIKYTESIKKFNDLMMKFVISKEIPNDQSNPTNDQQTFNKIISNKMNPNRESKSSSHKMHFMPDIKLEVRNGSFLRPKNYHISEQKQLKIDKIDRKNDYNINRVHMNQSIVGGILTYTSASNAYSKLLKGSTCKNVTSHLAKIEEKIFKK